MRDRGWSPRPNVSGPHSQSATGGVISCESFSCKGHLQELLLQGDGKGHATQAGFVVREREERRRSAWSLHQ
eukprot:269719-Chlamydomonas_euryale.AAC.1